MRQKSIDLLKFLIGWPLSLVALYFIYTTFANRLQDVTTDLTSLKPEYLALSILCFVSYYFLRSCVWYSMLRFRDYNIDYTTSTYLWATSQLKRYIPGNIWSFLGLGVAFGKKGVEKRHVANSIVIEEQLVLVSASILSLLCLPFIIDNFFPFVKNIPILQTLVPIIFILGLVLYIYIPKILSKSNGKIRTIASHIFPHFTPIQNFTLVCLMGASFLAMALGYFFVISSLTNLPLGDFTSLIGLFIFALLVGYLSFIFPTGLGVREGIITLGLSKIVPLGLAGFVAIFSRIVLILSELLAIGIAYILMKGRKSFLQTPLKYISQNLHYSTVILGVLLFSLYFSYVSMLRYDNFYTGRFDLGNMSQTVWNTTQGRIFQLTNPDGTEIVSRLAFHSDYFLLLMTPFYMLWSDPRVLLLTQAILVAIGAIFVYLLAQHILKNKTIATILALLYLLNPALERAVLYDFHAVVPATTCILAAFYFMIQKRYGWFIVFSLLAAITKEQVWFLIGLFGMYVAIFQKKYLFGGIVAVVSLLLFYLHIWHFIPAAGKDTVHFAVSYYSEDSTSPSDILKSILFDPARSLQIATDGDRLNYYKQLLGPLGFLPLAAPLFLIFATPDLVINIFSQKSELYTIYYQYTAVITPFLFIATIYGIQNLRKFIPQIPLSLISIYLVGVGLYSAYLFGPLPGASDANIAVFTRPQQNKEAIKRELRRIPQAARVASTNNLGPQLSHREYLYTLPLGIDEAEYIAFLLRDNSPALEKEAFVKVTEDKRFRLEFTDNTFYIFKRTNI
jgi:uncharacterized membrane protein/uncharacterized membrane protein YbhN (UPF0104 family)